MTDYMKLMMQDIENAAQFWRELEGDGSEKVAELEETIEQFQERQNQKPETEDNSSE